MEVTSKNLKRKLESSQLFRPHCNPGNSSKPKPLGFYNEEESMVFLPNAAASGNDVPGKDPLQMDAPSISTPPLVDLTSQEVVTTNGSHPQASQDVDNDSVTAKIIEVTSDDMPYSCDICGQGFQREKQFKVHMRVHDREKLYSFKCPICPKIFKTMRNLNDHGKSHPGITEHCCKECGKYFKKKSKLDLHMRGHTGERPFICKLCGKGYMVGTSLRDHLKKHRAEFPFSCKKCDDLFQTKEHLREHENTHPKKKPFACSFCEESFNQFTSLKEHLRQHI